MPHLAVWKFENGIKPIHDDVHVKGGIPDDRDFEADDYGDRYDFGPLYELVKNQKTPLLENKSFLHYYFSRHHTVLYDDTQQGANPESVHTICLLRRMYQ